MVAFPVLGTEGECLEFLVSTQSSGPPGDLPEECRFLLSTQLLFLDKKEPSTQIFDKDEWIRSLTEAEASTADIPEVQVTFAAQGRLLFENTCPGALSEGGIAAGGSSIGWQGPWGMWSVLTHPPRTMRVVKKSHVSPHEEGA